MNDILQCFEKYKEDAERSFDPKFVCREIIMANAKAAALSEENLTFISDFLDYADEKLMHFIWQYYYLLF